MKKEEKKNFVEGDGSLYNYSCYYNSGVSVNRWKKVNNRTNAWTGKQWK